MISFFNAVNTYSDASTSKDKYGNTVICAGYVTTFQHQIIDNGMKIVSGATNNYGEVLAAYMGISNLLSHKDYDAFLNLFSDSEITVKGLKEWIYTWLRDMDPETKELRNSSGAIVSNQEIFCNMINCIITNNTHVAIWHQRGHKNPDKVADMEEVRNTFRETNGTEISSDIIREICYYNDFVDNMTRDYLIEEINKKEYEPNLYMKPKIVVSRVLQWKAMSEYRKLIL